MDHSKIVKFLNDYRKILKPADDQDKFYLAICQVQLGNYAEAQQLFEKSCEGMLKTRLWQKTSQPNWLVDICVLSGREDLYPKVLRELETYKTDSRGDSLVALYAYALIEVLMHIENDITNWIQGLLKKPKVKDTFAIGQTLQAILDEDQIALDSALANLLKAHEGMARYGNLRETAEGLLCMPAMSLTYVALKRKLKVRVENEYLSIGYLQHLLKYGRE
jgi:tetratricopeptide (TPR) repeat protein